MKKVYSLLLTFFIGALAAQAQLLVYQGRSSLQSSGDGYSISVPLKFFMVIAPESNHVAQIFYYNTLPYSSHYDVDRGEVVMSKVSGKNGKHSTVFMTAGKSGTSYVQMHYVGADSALKNDSSRTVSFPRSFKGTHHTLNTAVPASMSDSSVTATFSEKRTIAANAAGKTIDEVLDGLQAELEADGIYPFGDSLHSSSGVVLTAPPTPPSLPAPTTGGQ